MQLELYTQVLLSGFCLALVLGAVANKLLHHGCGI